MDAFDNPARNGMAGPQREGAPTDQANDAMAAGNEFLAAAAGVTATASAIPLAIQAILVPDASGRIVLPAGVSIDDITVSGADLVITLPNGQVMIIPGGAVNIPSIVVDGDTVPASTVAQLLENLGELNPEAGIRSSGGNFADPEGAIQDPYALGDLLPYTELAFPQPENREIIPAIPEEEDPTVVIVTPDQPAGSVDATASVNEAGLPARGNEPAGSNSAANIETVTGSILFDTPDGAGSVTINGTAITAVGQVITTPIGQLTITSIAAGNVGYSYTLTDNTNANNNVTDVFAVVVTDIDGDTATADLTVSIIDDVPTARVDTDAVAAGTFTPETGNVLTGAGTTSGAAGADTQGADGASLTGIRAGATGTEFAAPGAAIQGQYGTLTIDAQGNYSYARTPGTPGGVSDVFTYRLTDGDGDTSTATLTISIADSSTVITSILAENVVEESQLAGRNGETPGSAFDGDGETTTGAMGFTARDGVGSVTINGVAITPGALPQTIFSDATGTLTINAYVYDPATGNGSVVYTYTLNDNTLDANGTVVPFNIVVTDSDGDSSSGILRIQIIDDVPTAVNDVDSVTEDSGNGENPPIADGNVLTGSGGSDANGTDGSADIQGADGATVTAVAGGTVGQAFAAAYGSLTLNADGSYTYVLNNASQPVQGLSVGETLTEVFTYTITDGDGDTSTATLTITINGANDGVTINGLNVEGGELIVDEDNLIDGSSPDAAALTQSGNFTVSTPDGLGNVTIGGVQVVTNGVFTAGTVTSPLGVVNITGFTPVTGADGSVIGGTFTYEYVLSNNTLTHGPQGEDKVTDSFAVIVTDSDGSTGNASLDVVIIDDVPTAANDADSVTEDSGNGENPPTADGNVLTGAGGNDANATDGVKDVQGADGATVTAVTGGTIGEGFSTTYGTLTLNSDGSYTYVLNNQAQPVQGLSVGETLTEVFTYTITDGDGDTSTATLTITINGADDGVTIRGLDVEGGELIVNEDDLIDGSSPDAAALTQSDTFTVSTPDGLGNVTIGGTQVVTNGVFTAGAATSPLGVVNITGFTPVIGTDGSVIGGTFTYEYVLSDNTLTHGVQGEDNVTDSFAVTVTDSDGSTGNASLDVTIIDDVPTATAEASQNVAEGATVTGTLDFVAGADGASVTHINATALVFGGDGYSQAIDIGDGMIKVKADGSYSFTADASVVGNGAASATFTVTDGDNDTATAPISFVITDANVPTAGNTAASVDDDALAGGNAGGTGDLPDANIDGDNNQATFSGVLTHNFGGDGAGSIGFAAMNGTTGTVGTETVNYVWNALTNTLTATGPRGPLFTVQVTDPATGAYKVTLLDNVLHVTGNAENDATATLSYTVTDADGSPATGSLNITFDDDTPTLGTIPNGAASNNPAAVTTTGAIPFLVGADSPVTVGTITANVSGMTSGGHTLVTNQTGNVLTAYADTDNDGIYDAGTDTAVFTLTINPGATQYVFDLLAPLDGDVVNTPISGASAFGAGPTQSQILTGGGGDVSVVAGWMTSGAFNAATWYSTGAANPAGLTLSSVNGSSGGWGIANNNFNNGEFMRFDFGAPADDFDGPGGYTPPPAALPEVSYATLSLTNFGAADTLQLVVHYTDGTFGNLTTAGNVGTLNLQAPAGKFIDWIDIYGQSVGGGGGKISLVNAGVTTTTVAETIGFTVTLTDADGDPVTGGFSVSITDGAPTAVNDDISLTEGGPISVIFDVDTNDNPGPDGFGSRTFTSVTGTYGSLTLNGDGTQTYTLNAAGQAAINALPPGQTLTDIFNYTLTDTDGDSDSARVTVTLTGTDDGVTITNLTPAIGGGDATVDEDDLPLGSDTAKESLTVPGTFNISAPDGVANLSIHGTQVIADGVFTPATIPTPLGNTLNITAYDAATGQVSYTYTLNGAETHANGANENELFENFVVELTDSDGDNTSDTLAIRIIDDVPSVTATAAGAAIALNDETATTSQASTIDTGAIAKGDDPNVGGTGAISVASSGSAVVTATPVYGADGAAVVNPLTYALSVTNAASGLTVTDGSAINLVLQGNVIVGQVSGGAFNNQAAFAISIDPVTGVVRVEQYLSLNHPVTTNPDDTVSLLAGRLGVVVTATDRDGDPATSNTVDISAQIRFDDDGPTVDIVANDTNSVVLTTRDAATIGAAFDTATSTVNFGGVFTHTSAPGSDGAGAVTFNYALSLTVAPGTDSGLDSNGLSIFLYTGAGGTIVGSTSATSAGVTSANTIFSLGVNAGTGAVTLTQNAEIDHAPNADTSAPYDDQFVFLANNLVRLTGTATIVDGDGDSVSDTAFIDLGNNIRFADDGPSITVGAPLPTLTVDESNLGINAVSAAVFTPNFGADGAGTVTYALGINAGSTGLVDTATGQPVTLSVVGGQVVGTAGGFTVFTVAVDANGSLTLDQQRAIMHSNGGAVHDDAKSLATANLVTLTATVTDGDGDSATATINLGDRLTFKDDGPTVIADSGTTTEATLDFNAAFVLDFSGSIDDTELNTMLNAVREAGLLLFGSSSGNVSIRLVGFSSTASNLGVFTDPVAFIQAIDNLNPAEGGTRPFDGGTDFTAGIEQLMSVYVPNPNASNQVFFLSDGNPNEQTGTGGNSLADTTRANWINFVNTGDVNVTAIGVGNGISIPRLQDVDVDGDGAPILATDFDDLVQTLLDIVVALPVSGDLDANDNFGADGGRILSITVSGTTYTWDGNNTITRTGTLTGNVAGNSISATTPEGATLTLNFLTGIWSYAPDATPTAATEVFNYSVIDRDGDTAGSTLSVTVVEGGGPGGGNIAAADIVITNASGSGAAIQIAEAALLANDQAGTTVTGAATSVTDATSVTRGGGNFTFTDNDTDGGSFFYSTTPSDTARVTVNRAQAGETQLDGTSANDILVGRDGADDIIVGKTGSDYMYGLGGNDTFNLANGHFGAGEYIDGGAGTDGIVLTNGTTVNFSTGTIIGVETLTGSSSADNVTVSAQQWAAFNSIGLGGSSDTLTVNVTGSVDISGATLTTLTSVETGNLTGSGGADTITLTGAQLNAILAGTGTINLGGGTDTINLTSTSTDLNGLSNAGLSGVEVISAAGASGGVKIMLANQSEGFTLTGSAFGDTLAGGTGVDNLTGGAGADQFRFRSTTNGTDVVNDYVDGTDKIGFLDTGSTDSGIGSVNFTNTAGDSAGVTLNANDFVTRAGITSIAGADDAKVIRITAAQTDAQITGDTGANNSQNSYVIVFNSTTGRGEVWFDTDWDNAASRVKVATLNNITSLAQLNQITEADIVVYNNATDPIILDLNGDGYSFGATALFDIDADGAADKVTWNSSNDGILAVDLDGNGRIDNGTEIFTPGFGGGKFANGTEALASLDDNGDGVIDAKDAAFAQLLVWQDANADGVSDAGELSGLADHGITSISTGAAYADETIDGQAVTARGSFTRTDGSTGEYIEAQLDAQLGARGADREAEDAQRTAGNQALTSSLVAASLVAMAQGAPAQADTDAKPVTQDLQTTAAPVDNDAAPRASLAPTDTASTLGAEDLAATKEAKPADSSASHLEDASPAAASIDDAQGSDWHSDDAQPADTAESDALFDMAPAQTASPMDGLLTLGLAAAEQAAAAAADTAVKGAAAEAVLADLHKDGGLDYLIDAVVGTGSQHAANDDAPAIDLTQFLSSSVPGDMGALVHQSVENDLHQMAAQV